MMVDYLIAAFDETMLRQKWNLEPHEPLYPPKHLGYVVNMLLWEQENFNFIDVARLITYVLLDLRYTLPPQQQYVSHDILGV